MHLKVPQNYSEAMKNLESSPTSTLCNDAFKGNFETERSDDILILYGHLAAASARLVFNFVSNNFLYITEAMIVLFILFVIHKSYWSPVLYHKDLLDVGYDHVPYGSNRKSWIARIQETRRLGSKLPPPYPNGWFAIAESRDLKMGSVIGVDVLGQNLCLYRSENGQPHCVDAYCPHLGANMAVGGVVRGQCIECPFHKWQFDGSSGVCAAVPDMDSPLKGVSVKSWHTKEVDGAIWIWHDAENRNPLWEIEDAPELESWAYRGRNEFTVNSHIQDIPENGADVGHLNAVHSTSVLTKLAEKYPFLLNFIGQHVWSAQWSKHDDHTSEMRLKHDYRFGTIGLFHMEVVAKQLGPAHVRLIVHTRLGPLLISQSVTPLSPIEQKVVHRVFSPCYNAPFAAFFVIGESYMFERDVAIWNHKRYVSSPSYAKTDRTIRAFRSWYSQFYSENSLTFKDALYKQRNPLDW